MNKELKKAIQEMKDSSIDNMEKYQCNECLTIFTGIGSDTCPKCEGEMHLIINNSSPKVSEWEKEFRKKYNDMDCDDEIKFISSLLSSTEKRVAMEKDNELKQRVGMLRQWLNEDVITDPSKLVENEDLLKWLIKSKYE